MNNFKKHIFKAIYDSVSVIGCEQSTTSGGVGVTEYSLLLNKPLGGIIVIDFDPMGVPDKLEIIHNGIKKATSGMTVSNAGPFDNIYGSPTIPNSTQAGTVDQFIGTNKGAVPTRYSTFTSETGITNIVMSKQQLIWWVYSDADYAIANNVTIRITGIDGTAWNLQRLCTEQTPTGVTTQPTPTPTPTPTEPSGGSIIGFSSMSDLTASVTYVDGFGVEQTIFVYTENGDCVTFYARSVSGTNGCTQCL